MTYRAPADRLHICKKYWDMFCIFYDLKWIDYEIFILNLNIFNLKKTTYETNKGVKIF